MMSLFQSTRPLRGATTAAAAQAPTARHFNPRAPCGARHDDRHAFGGLRYFNPRAPCGARLFAIGAWLHTDEFQSTRPLRGATVVTRTVTEGVAEFQSTRPLRGATKPTAELISSEQNFNPRAPCGARQQTCTKNMYMFVRTDKRNSFPCRTLSVRAPDEKL